MLLQPIDTMNGEVLPSGAINFTPVELPLIALARGENSRGLGPQGRLQQRAGDVDSTSEANIRMLIVLQRASMVVTILFVMAVTGLMGLLWRAVVAQVHDPLISAVIVGAMTLFLPFAVRMLTPDIRA